MPTHHTGKLLLIMAKDEVNLSVFELVLLPAVAPMTMPISEMMIVAVVNNSIVRGSFSSMISPTAVEPPSLVVFFFHIQAYCLKVRAVSLEPPAVMKFVKVLEAKTVA